MKKKGNVIIKFNGGLGNQMFQWALARMIEEITDMDVLFDMSYFSKNYARPYQLNIFKIEPQFVTDLWTKSALNIIWTFRKFLNNKKFLGYTLYEEKQFNFDKHINSIKQDTYIAGYFQSELYFHCVADRLREDFKFDYLLNDKNKDVIRQISAGNSISLHIRRGDYVNKQRNLDAYAACPLDYYKRGVEYIAQQYPNPTLFIFSDDIKWVKENLKLPYESVYVSHNTGEKSFEDMRLMGCCKHNIIANSSFSWWGAWLNNNPNKIVIAPKRWFNDENIIQTDVIPKDWVKMEN